MPKLTLLLATLTTILALFLPITQVQAQANGATLSCVAPTTNTDGSTITAAQKPLVFKFFEGTVSGTHPNASPNQTTCNFIFTGLAAGTHFFVATAIDAKGAQSAQSTQTSKVVVNATPSAPSMLTAQADSFAYQIVQAPNQITALAMGTAPAGTPCDMSQSFTDAAHGTLYLVPFDKVVLPNGTQNTKKRTVFASCG